ncbi:MAG: VanW family protein [Lachnospiraceae bacterium]|nr:VanW family protein [Lachnospiraceae bacterium]
MTNYRTSPRRSVGRRRRRRIKRIRQAIVVLGILLLGVGIFFLVRGIAVSREELELQIQVDGEDVSEMSREEALVYLNKKHPWNLVITHGTDRFTMENLIGPEISSVVDEAYAEADKAREEFESRSFMNRVFSFGDGNEVSVVKDFSLQGYSARVSEVVEELSEKWGTHMENSRITGYDSSTGEFVVSEGKDGKEVDRDKLESDLNAALTAEDYDREIPVSIIAVSPSINAADFKTMSSYTTHTTANQKRNTNVKLASQSVNGIILEPGEQFSFNTVLGKRTPEKGYQEAGAYADGQTVQEYGGGVCQVSSTLYNAVISAGLRTDNRLGHTFEPSYVTPGQDATVSYPKPDFIFTNTSPACVGIKTSFHDRTMHVELFGIPLLEEGEKRYMESEKTGESDPPAPIYTEDPAVPFGTEVQVKAGSNGSVWKTYIVTEKDGQVIDRTYLHQTRYKGHSAQIHRNTQFPTPETPVPTDPNAVDPNAVDPNAVDPNQASPAPAPTPETPAAPATPETPAAPAA